ncbi:hypothetical protein ACSBPH_15695 [Microbacterium sp. F51-2R]|jgi:hypothetical protein|uniref:hypothetical protein n=1 Tax=Microbacterium sp. F51-2R TaxID=3445777 RepID=UPI003F9F7D1F
MSDFREPIPDDDREVRLDDDAETEPPPPTIDPLESIEDDVDELTAEEREAAIESGQIEP